MTPPPYLIEPQFYNAVSNDPVRPFFKKGNELHNVVRLSK